MKATSITIMAINRSNFRNNTSGSYGGAIRIYEGTTMTVDESKFCLNTADTGGAIFANSIIMFLSNNTVVSSNKGNSGAVYLLKVKATFSHITYFNNTGSLFLSNSKAYFSGQNTFVSNHGTKQTLNQKISGFQGGAITAFQSDIEVNGKYTLVDNFAQNGGAVYATESKLYVNNQTTIANNGATEGGGGIYLYHSEINCQDGCTLELLNNSAVERGGGIHAISSSVKVYTGETHTSTSVVCFSENSAKKGGGLCLEVNAKLYVLKPYSYSSDDSLYALQFTSNTADYGGAVYVADDINSRTCASTSYTKHYTSTECFIQTLVLHGTVSSCVNLLNTEFIQNHAEISGSTLYGGLLDRCTVSPSAEVYINYDSQQPDVMSGTTYITSITNINVTSVSSGPVRVCYCNGTKPDCGSKLPPVHVPKGGNFTVSLVAVDQLNNTVTSATIHSSLNSTEGGLMEGQLTQSTSEACTKLTFNVFSPHESEELILYPAGPCKDAKLSQSRLLIHFTACRCPVGFQPKATYRNYKM